MASARGSALPWDEDNEKEKSLVVNTEYSEIMRKNRVKLRDLVQLDEMWSHLRQLDVITKDQEVILQHNSPPMPQLVERLLDYLEKCPAWRFHGFLRCCALTGQEHVITKIGLDPADYNHNLNKLESESENIQQSGATTVEGGSIPTLWDKHNKNQQKVVFDTKYSEIMKKNRVKLRDKVQPDKMWCQLCQLNVVTKNTEENLRQNSRSRHRLVEKLLDYLDTCPAWRFHGFLRCCAMTGQEQIITEIGLDLGDYNQGIDKPITGSQMEHVQLAAVILAVIMRHCDSCIARLLKMNLYDLQDHPCAEVLDISKCYIKIMSKYKGGHGCLVEIAEKDVLRPLDEGDTLRAALLYGPPGAGKTTFLQHLVYVWSKTFLQKLQSNQQLCLADVPFTSLVYIPGRAIKDSVEQAIYDHLWCKEEHRDILYRHVMEGNGTGIIFDAVNEVHSQEIRAKLTQFVKERSEHGGPVILMSARTDLCWIPSKLFDRHLFLQGFTEDQGREYILLCGGRENTQSSQLRNARIKRSRRPSGKRSPITQENVQSFAKTDIQVKVLEYFDTAGEKLNPILTNPLRLHVFCALAMKGLLSLEDTEVSSIIKLFAKLEKCLLARAGDVVSEDQSRAFYRMCMHGLLEGMREFPSELLALYSIADNFYVFLDKHDHLDTNISHITYAFPHEVIHEYFASRYFFGLPENCQGSLLLCLCSQRKFWNLQFILFELIAKQESHAEELTKMIRGIMLLQSDLDEGTEVNRQLDKVFRVSDEENSLKDMLLYHEVSTPTEVVNKTWKQIDDAFDINSHYLRSRSLFNSLVQKGTINHVVKCLNICEMQQKLDVTQATLHPLLPCQYEDIYGDQHSFYKTGGYRWAHIIDDGRITAWNVDDAVEAIQQHKEKQESESTGMPEGPVTTSSLSFHSYHSLWGDAADSMWSETGWKKLLAQLKEMWGMEDLNIWLLRPVPLLGFLSCLPDCQFSENVRIRVEWGTVYVDDLLTAVCQKSDIRLKLFVPTIVLPGDVDEGTLIAKRDKLCWATNVNGERVLDMPYWVTESGDEYIWSDDWEMELKKGSLLGRLVP